MFYGFTMLLQEGAGGLPSPLAEDFGSDQAAEALAPDAAEGRPLQVPSPRTHIVSQLLWSALEVKMKPRTSLVPGPPYVPCP